MNRGRPRIEVTRPEIIDVIGIIPDGVVAGWFDVSPATIVACRKRLGVEKSVDVMRRITELEQTIAKLIDRIRTMDNQS